MSNSCWFKFLKCDNSVPLFVNFGSTAGWSFWHSIDNTIDQLTVQHLFQPYITHLVDQKIIKDLKVSGKGYQLFEKLE